WNRKAEPGREPALEPSGVFGELETLLGLDPVEFVARFRGSALTRTKRAGLLRNAAIVLANRGERRAVGALNRALGDDDAVVRRGSRGREECAREEPSRLRGRLGGSEIRRGALQRAGRAVSRADRLGRSRLPLLPGSRREFTGARGLSPERPIDVTHAPEPTGWVGRPMLRREDRTLLTGRGRFVDALAVPGALHLPLARCPP